MEPREREIAVRQVIRARRIVTGQRERMEMLARNETASAERTLDAFTSTLNIFEEKLRRILAYEESDSPF
jgi:hypothetical protein